MVAASVGAQPTYEIGYAFNGEPERVRIETAPFVVAETLSTLPVLQQLLMEFPFSYDRSLGLVNVEGRIEIDLDDPQAFESVGRSSVLFDDLTFSGPSSEPIVVDLFVDPGEYRVRSSQMPVGATCEMLIEVEVAGQVRAGVIRSVWEGSGAPRTELSGIFGSGGPPAIAEGFVVPVGRPVSLRIQFTRRVSLPASTTGSIWFRSASEGWRAPGLPIGSEVFRMPAGIRVDSPQAGVRDNYLVVCLADLDDDGDLTIFDFLSFQNLFDAGDPLADFDLDGELTIFDFLAFQNAFDAGCS